MYSDVFAYPWDLEGSDVYRARPGIRDLGRPQATSRAVASHHGGFVRPDLAAVVRFAESSRISFQPELRRYGGDRCGVRARGECGRRAGAIGALRSGIAPDGDASRGIVPTVRTLMELDVTRMNIYNYGLVRRPSVAAIGQSLAGGSAALRP